MLYKCNWPFIQRRFYSSLHILLLSLKDREREGPSLNTIVYFFEKKKKTKKKVRGRCYKDQTIKRN